MTNLEQPLKNILGEVLSLDTSQFTQDTHLLGALPQFDSMAIMTLLVEMESIFNFSVETAEISAENFQTFGSLLSFVTNQYH